MYPSIATRAQTITATNNPRSDKQVRKFYLGPDIGPPPYISESDLEEFFFLQVQG